MKCVIIWILNWQLLCILPLVSNSYNNSVISLNCTINALFTYWVDKSSPNSLPTCWVLKNTTNFNSRLLSLCTSKYILFYNNYQGHIYNSGARGQSILIKQIEIIFVRKNRNHKYNIFVIYINKLVFEMVEINLHVVPT